jgi:hypothetical protein
VPTVQRFLLLDNVTTLGPSGFKDNLPSTKTVQASVTGSGAVSATVVIEGSNDAKNFIAIGTITLSGTGSATDGFVSDAPWVDLRANLTALSGTNAAVSVALGGVL